MRWIVGLVFLLLAACSREITLQAGLQDAEANEIVALLSHYGIDAKKQATKTGVALAVREPDITRATDIMRAAGLPRRALSNLGDMFKKDGMISTPMEERIRYIHGLSQELEYTLQQFDNVIAARVHVVLPERIAPGERIQPSSASVFVKYREPFDEDANVPRIRSLVANSIPGLSGPDERAKIAVVLAPSSGALPATGEKNEKSGGSIVWWLLGTALALVLLIILMAMARRHPRSLTALNTRAAAPQAPAPGPDQG